MAEASATTSLPRSPRASAWLVRGVMRYAPQCLRRAAARVPYSRFTSLASRFLWGRARIRWRGCTVEVNPGEVHGYYLYVLGDYATEEIDTLIDQCTNAKVFADVGAHVGLVSLSLAHACPGLEVFAFEPDEARADSFTRNLTLNDRLAPRIRLERVAMAAERGEAGFQPAGEANTGVGRLVPRGSSAPLSVRTERLDAYFEARGPLPDVVKIDVEGAELDVLRGMAGLFARGHPRTMLIEVHGFYHGEGAARFHREVQELLATAGYRSLRLQDGHWLAPGDACAWPSRCHLLCTRADAASA